ncbi:MAG: hypothetical protein J0L62_12840 [Bacteroidetes bacterium]|nr:hypothetical protein [Bacteroidota bacterium]
MRLIYFFLLTVLVFSCTGSKGAYNTQRELDAYLGNTSKVEFTPLSPAEQNSKVVVFDYLVKINGSKVSGIKVLDFMNSGQINYWIHFRTTAISNANTFVIPGPIPSFKSKIDLFIKVTDSKGVTYYNNETIDQFFILFKGKYLPDLSGQSKIELTSIPSDCEIEFSLNQELSSIPFSIRFQFMEEAVYRKVNFRVDTGNDLYPAYLTSQNTFSFLNENKTETLIEKFVEKNDSVSDGTLQLSGNFSIQSKDEKLSSIEPIIFYFPLPGEKIDKADQTKAAKLNLKRSTLNVLSVLADFQKTSYITAIKTHLRLGMDTDTKLKTQPVDQQMKAISQHISSVGNWNEIAKEHFDPFFINYDVSFVKNISTLLWFSNIGIQFPGFCIEKETWRILIKEVSTQKKCNSNQFVEFKF